MYNYAFIKTTRHFFNAQWRTRTFYTQCLAEDLRIDLVVISRLPNRCALGPPDIILFLQYSEDPVPDPEFPKLLNMAPSHIG